MVTENRRQCCENCKWWERLAATHDAGSCHRQSPKIIIELSEHALWPDVYAGDFCGEWIAKQMDPRLR